MIVMIVVTVRIVLIVMIVMIVMYDCKAGACYNRGSIFRPN